MRFPGIRAKAILLASVLALSASAGDLDLAETNPAAAVTPKPRVTDTGKAPTVTNNAAKPKPAPKAKPTRTAAQTAPGAKSVAKPTAPTGSAARASGSAETATLPKKDSLAVAAKPTQHDTVPKDTLPKPLRDIGQKALKVPEKLLFDIIWGGWGLSWITAGQATLELLPTGKPETWKIQSLAWGNNFFQSIYPVSDTVFSLIDARGIYPSRFEKRLHEGKYNAALSASYDQAAHTLRTQDTTLSIEPFSHDVLSAFYFIRTQHLEVGDSLDLAAVSGKKKYKLKVLCHARETITVPAGEFKTLVVEPMLKDDGLFKAKGKLTIWVTDDASHTPVRMMSKIPVGSIKAELVKRN